ncbi:MAG: DMSO reductase [Clostridia bacterium]|nr:MAG: DMSO reductase [Clostridia bacterium]
MVTVSAKRFRHLCPRNCFSTCAIISTVENGRLVRVEGDPEHGFTRGRLCAKGYAYPQLIYSRRRITVPMRQYPRGSGHWHRISWEEALTTIAAKILELKGRYGSLLSVCLNKQSGNFGYLHYAVEGMFNAMGYITRAEGNSCWSAGLDARIFDLGADRQSDPEDMALARSIVLWGVNPAWTAVHQMHFITMAREQGATLVVIDPLYTATAAQADYYIQVRPGEDGALALGVARYILERGWQDEDFLREYVLGWPEFRSYLEREVSVVWAAEKAGVAPEAVAVLAKLLAWYKPAAIWTGMGLQRHTNGGQNVRAITAPAAMTGNLGQPGGGLYYASQQTWNLLKYNARDWPPPPGATGWVLWPGVVGDGAGDGLEPVAGGGSRPVGAAGVVAGRQARAGDPGVAVGHRPVNTNDFARQVLACTDPPVKMLWVASRGLASQDPLVTSLEEAMGLMETVVLVDHFLTPTARFADIFLPATTPFEEWDVVLSYWHYWLGINQPAIAPVGESRSDLEIAMHLSAKMNELSPGSCTFPTSGSQEEWVAAEFTPEIYVLADIRDYRELLDRPRKLAWPRVSWEGGKFATPSGKYELCSEQAQKCGLPSLPVYVPPAAPSPAYPYRLLTSHQQLGINSQFLHLGWLGGSERATVLLPPGLARRLGVRSGMQVCLYNASGEVVLPAMVSRQVPEDVLLCYQGWYGPGAPEINAIVGGLMTDMGSYKTGFPAPALYDTFVNIYVL